MRGVVLADVISAGPGGGFEMELTLQVMVCEDWISFTIAMKYRSRGRRFTFPTVLAMAYEMGVGRIHRTLGVV